MRLINCSTRRLEEFLGSDIPDYAILSHTWGDEEVSFANLSSSYPNSNPKITTRSGYQKIIYTCQQAIHDGFGYAWIDTCCIDKGSSAELSEAINSMFTWYKNSARCYAYLSDVSEVDMGNEFCKSRWFARGWTLQELLAPKDVDFFDRKWNHLGTKSENAGWISTITGIDAEALLGTRDNGQSIGLGSFCVAKRMSWASARQTTREEDIAYCLLGIFDINMPLLYGEGNRAFLRLQEEIIRKIDDDSILAWDLKPEMDHGLGPILDNSRNRISGLSHGSGILASSPKDFANCGNLRYAAESASPFTLTKAGLQIKLPLLPLSEMVDAFSLHGSRGWIGLLSCSTGSTLKFLGILLYPTAHDQDSNAKFTRARAYTFGAYYHTVVVGSRAAARSVLKTVTITGFEEGQKLRDWRLGYRQFVVNESRALNNVGYQVRSGTAWDIADWRSSESRYNPIWDPGAMILTIEGEARFRDIIEFCFEPLSGRRGTTFTVFMRTINSRVIVRKGDVFSDEDRRDFYVDLEHEYPQNDLGNVIIHDSEGSSFHVSVEIRATRVYNHRIFEVNVDALQVMTGDS
jgi:hypothetical protein